MEIDIKGRMNDSSLLIDRKMSLQLSIFLCLFSSTILCQEDYPDPRVVIVGATGTIKGLYKRAKIISERSWKELIG